MRNENIVSLDLSADELRYIVRCGSALAQNIPVKSLPTYCGFDVDQINEFSSKIRHKMDEIGVDL